MIDIYECACGKKIDITNVKKGETFHCHKFDSKQKECFRIAK